MSAWGNTSRKSEMTISAPPQSESQSTTIATFLFFHIVWTSSCALCSFSIYFEYSNKLAQYSESFFGGKFSSLSFWIRMNSLYTDAYLSHPFMDSPRNYTTRTSHHKYLLKKKKYQSQPHAQSEKNNIANVYEYITHPEGDIFRIVTIAPTHKWKNISCISLSSWGHRIIHLDSTHSAFPHCIIGDCITLWEDDFVWIIERKSLLTRYKWDTDRFNNRVLQSIAANVDIVVIVASASNPKFQPGFIDRYMILAASANIPVIICITKSDLQTIDDPVLDYYEHQLHIPVVYTSTLSNIGIDELKNLIHGKTVVFVGKSGVGKSSIVNTLFWWGVTRTSHVSLQGWQWRHTTTSSHMYPLDNETYIIDTPGIRSLEFLEFSWKDLSLYFPEFLIPSRQCRYRDCKHLTENECGIKAALKSKEIQEFRYKTYARLMEEAKN